MLAFVLTMFALTSASFAGGASELPEGSGKQLVEAACTSCHSLEMITNKSWRKEKWMASVQAMVERGAAVSKAEIPRVADYLTIHFGPKDPGKELVNDVCTFCHGFAQIRSQRLTRSQWESVIKGMISEGAPVTNEEFVLIVDYLAKNFGPPKEEE